MARQLGLCHRGAGLCQPRTSGVVDRETYGIAAQHQRRAGKQYRVSQALQAGLQITPSLNEREVSPRTGSPPMSIKAVARSARTGTVERTRTVSPRMRRTRLMSRFRMRSGVMPDGRPRLRCVVWSMSDADRHHTGIALSKNRERTRHQAKAGLRTPVKLLTFVNSSRASSRQPNPLRHLLCNHLRALRACPRRFVPVPEVRHHPQTAIRHVSAIALTGGGPSIPRVPQSQQQRTRSSSASCGRGQAKPAFRSAPSCSTRGHRSRSTVRRCIRPRQPVRRDRSGAGGAVAALRSSAYRLTPERRRCGNQTLCFATTRRH